MNNILLLFYSPKPWSQVWIILIYQKWSIFYFFYLSIVTIPEVFAKVNSTQFPSRILSNTYENIFCESLKVRLSPQSSSAFFHMLQYKLNESKRTTVEKDSG